MCWPDMKYDIRFVGFLVPANLEEYAWSCPNKYNKGPNKCTAKKVSDHYLEGDCWWPCQVDGVMFIKSGRKQRHGDVFV